MPSINPFTTNYAPHNRTKCPCKRNLKATQHGYLYVSEIEANCSRLGVCRTNHCGRDRLRITNLNPLIPVCDAAARFASAEHLKTPVGNAFAFWRFRPVKPTLSQINYWGLTSSKLFRRIIPKDQADADGMEFCWYLKSLLSLIAVRSMLGWMLNSSLIEWSSYHFVILEWKLITTSIELLLRCVLLNKQINDFRK